MLQDIRKNSQGTAAKIIVGLIVVAFAGFGVESILLGSGNTGVATVNGEDISPGELQQAVNGHKRRLVSMLGDQLDPAMLDEQRVTSQAMEMLVQRKLMTQSAKNMGLVVSDAQVGTAIGSMDQFKLEGVFSPEVYRSTLSSVGFTPASFKQTLQEDMAMAQVRSGLTASEFATSTEIALNATISNEQRDLRYLTIPIDLFLGEQVIGDEDIQSYYAQNPSAFLSQESLELDYIEMNTADFIEPVEEGAVVAAYEQAIQDYQYQTENRVSHIMFQLGDDESSEAFTARIEAVREKLSSGADFAALATEFSDDIGSASAGGDLGFSSGDAFPEEMEAAIADLELAVVSEPVVTEAGTHLLMVTGRRDGTPPNFLEMRGGLEQNLAQAEARVTLLRTVEELKDLAFNADGLKGPAEKLSLELSQASNITRTHSEGLFGDASLLSAAFSDDVLSSGHNSEVIELSEGRFVVLRVREHRPAVTLPLADVRDEIIAQVTQERASQAMQAEAARALVALRSGTSVEEFATEAGYAWQVELAADRRNPIVPAAVLNSAFSLAVPPSGQTTFESVVSASKDTLVYELVRVTPGQFDTLPEAEQVALRQLIAGESANLVASEYQQGLRDIADITVL